MKEKKAREEDALHATRAAVEEGIVPGGGVALLRASIALRNLKVEGDEQTGVNIVGRACEDQGAFPNHFPQGQHESSTGSGGVALFITAYTINPVTKL